MRKATMPTNKLAAVLLAAALLTPYNAPASSGLASYYGGAFHGRKTACGTRFDQHGLTAAHKTLPCGTKVRVTNLLNSKNVNVTITDRGPFHKGRVIDLSKGAAKKIGMLSAGLASVKIEVLKK
jgi:rare lipoprotein A